VKLNIPKRTERNYPLLRTLNEAIVITVDEMTQEENLVKDNEIIGIPSNVEGAGNKNNSPSKTTAPVALSFAALSLFAVLALKLL
jgi:hypothetical protein